MSDVYSSMKTRMAGLTMEVEDKSKTLSMLKKLLREARAAHRTSEEETASKEAEKLKKVRSEYESTIARHLGFIDRLLADKQSLSDKCDALADEMKRVESRHAARALDAQERHVAELKRQKEALAAGERARRERWTVRELIFIC
jgi:5-azacytidine-induced protein 1